jgi:hypothetical protein
VGVATPDYRSIPTGIRIILSARIVGIVREVASLCRNRQEASSTDPPDLCQDVLLDDEVTTQPVNEERKH